MFHSNPTGQNADKKKKKNNANLSRRVRFQRPLRERQRTSHRFHVFSCRVPRHLAGPAVADQSRTPERVTETSRTRGPHPRPEHTA